MLVAGLLSVVHPAGHGVQGSCGTVALYPAEKLPSGQGVHTPPTSPAPRAQPVGGAWWGEGACRLRDCCHALPR